MHTVLIVGAKYKLNNRLRVHVFYAGRCQFGEIIRSYFTRLKAVIHKYATPGNISLLYIIIIILSLVGDIICNRLAVALLTGGV